ncbi:CCR4-NOT transcription complex subunit 10-like [Amphibalanus amphitrite]|uniref:CCR4-NOT transcription complex subunit 10-like n=1 Tax=Amphibalanus amphitrite TaxID=1232801 RepID=UPI001C9217FF|nr:CCR4-NOT transcription complex subunit 10-like [Amphibalanus amphitrite]XP_043219297.1 CCR4-NOT transcription complex subunit 10-like [Amphibalanus amphitrite]XP_043219298.1 CCR4-NOT transcription complex subunit 10-like [Amphibalanus amphitrite]
MSSKSDKNSGNSDKELAVKAKSEFNKGNYGNCVQILEKLTADKSCDVKLAHNKAVAEFYKGGLKKTESFQKALKAIFEKAKLRPERLETLEDVDTCVLYYNYAVILYHLRQYRAALGIVSKISRYIEPLDDGTAKKICWLLAECCLSAHQPAQALDAVRFIEAKFVTKPEDARKKDGTLTSLALRMHRYRLRAGLQLHNLSDVASDVRLLADTDMSRAFIESYSEYLSGRGRSAVSVLNRVAGMTLPPYRATGEHVATMYYNNLACIHHYLNKPNVAGYYLRRAIAENDAATAPPAKTDGDRYGGVPVHAIGGSRHYELVYNAGIAFLHAGRPKQAFDCLTEAIQVYHTNPRLWLRLAECCILAHRQEKHGDEPGTAAGVGAKRQSLIQGSIGAGVHRKLILRATPTAASSDQISAAIPNPTLEFASLALRNACLILGEDGEGESPVTVEPANPVTPDQVQTLRCSVLSASSYVHLCLGDPVLALEDARKLLTQRLLAPAQRLLGHLYAAEALLLLDRADEALEHLTPDLSADVSLHAPDVAPSPVEQRWYPNSPVGARMCLQYNMAVVRTIRGELELAWNLLRTMNPAAPEVPPQVVQLALYLQLKHGNLDIVRSIIKQHSPQYR